jgi:hypothetical protein
VEVRGWKYDRDLDSQHDFVRRAYTGGVPMGSDLPDRPRNKSPRFLVAASKDALGANLDRIQVIKGWVDEKGEVRDKVFEVARAGDRELDVDGKLPAIGDTIDLATASYLNTLGRAQLSTVWEDPEFDPSQHALYYARVLEIPTPRWTPYDAVRAGLPLLKDVAATIQERAWSSPIWYTP